jgi:hypothetical protein
MRHSTTCLRDTFGVIVGVDRSIMSDTTMC